MYWLTVYPFIFIQLFCLIAGVMNLIRYVILLSIGTLCCCVLFYLLQLVCLIAEAMVCLIAEVMDLIRFAIL